MWLHRVRRVLIALVDERLEGLLRIELLLFSVFCVVRGLVVVLVELFEVDSLVTARTFIFRQHV